MQTIAVAGFGAPTLARLFAVLLMLTLAACDGVDGIGATQPTVQLQPADVTVVEGQRAEFTAAIAGQGGMSLQWRRNGQPIAGATAPTYVINAAALADNGAAFDLVGTNASGTVTTRAARLTVNPLVPPPAIGTQPSNATVALGQPASFTVVATGSGLTYQWQRGTTNIAGATAATYTIPATSPADDGATFRVVVTNPTGSVASNAATLAVVSPPTLTTSPTDATVVPGVTATFTVGATGAGLAYQWQRNGTAIAGATGASYTTPATVAGDDGATFRAVVSNIAGAVTSNAATLRVITPPTITTQPAGQAVNAGQTASFAVVAAGSGLSYQWQRNGTAIAGATGASYTTPATTAADNGAAFRVVVTNLAGSVTSSAAALSINLPPSITTQPASAGVTVGNTATFSVVAAGTGLSYQWQRGTTDIAGATGASYTTPATVIGDNGATFRVIVTNAAGSVTSSAATLAVTDPTPPSTFRTTPMVVGTDGSGIALKADGTVWAWGRNQHGELGQGDLNPSVVPVQVRTATGFLERIEHISASATHVVAVDADGFLWAWGATEALGVGAVGIGNTQALVAHRVRTDDNGALLPDVADAAAGIGVTVAALRSGVVVAWGSSARGATANNDSSGNPVPYPRNVGGLNNDVVEVAAGDNRAFARSPNGILFGWGDNTSGALGDGTVNTRRNPVEIGSRNVARVTAGATATHLILADGTARVMGRSHQVAGDATGFTLACSEQTYVLPAAIPKPITSESSFATVAAVTQAGVYVFRDRLYEVGDILSDNVSNSCTRALVQFGGLADVVGASGTWGRFTHVWTSDGKVYGIGENGDGQLGIGNVTAAAGARELVGFNLLGSAPTGNTVLSLDFEGALPTSVNPGSPNPAFLTPVQGFAGLGPSGNQFGGNMLRSQTGNRVTVTLTNLPPHSSVNLSLLFAAIDSLDGAGPFPAGDFFRITLDGQTIFREAFANATTNQVQTYVPPPGTELARRQQLGFTSGVFMDDSAYNFGADPQFQLIPHTASTLTLTFEVESSQLQDLNDESWGIDNLRISLNP